MFKEHNSKILDETCKVYSHQSGLTIAICPKPGCVNAFAGFATNYGSMDNKLSRDNKLSKGADSVTVPDGIAHFLEHKLFENEEVNADARFAKTGAAANAFTTFDKTCYYFTTTQNFYESFEILLDFVTHPYFTEETVKKEQGIIGQEIMMYNDLPGWVVFFNLLGAMYHNNPVKIDTAGTVESIAEITPQLLYDCYNAFYNLHNMVLVVVGDLDTDKILALCDSALKEAPPCQVMRTEFTEPAEVAEAFVSKELAVGLPMFALGYKTTPPAKENEGIEVAAAEIILDLVVGKSSDCYRRLYDGGLINSEFESEFFCGRGYASFMFVGESKDPQKASEEIKQTIASLKKSGITDSDFERAKSKLCGTMLRRYNSAETTGLAAVEEFFVGIPPFSYGEAPFSIQKSECEAFLAANFNENTCSLSVVLPSAQS